MYIPGYILQGVKEERRGLVYLTTLFFHGFACSSMHNIIVSGVLPS